jgi:hypothetical protein
MKERAPTITPQLGVRFRYEIMDGLAHGGLRTASPRLGWGGWIGAFTADRLA